MQKPNIPSQSRKYLTEAEMPNSIRTKLSVSELNNLRFFLDANDLKSVQLGFYAVTDDNWAFKKDNFICYCYSTSDEEVRTILSLMTLRYGSLEKAFNKYRKH
jgi:hypothetical protein